MNGGLVMKKNWNPNFFDNAYKYFDLCELIN